jgi:hypothetical protein
MMKAPLLSPFADLARLIDEASPADCPFLCGELEQLKAALWIKMTTGGGKATHPQPDRLLTAEEVAGRLNVTVGFVYRNARTYPFMVRQGRYVRFSNNGLELYIKRQQGK